MKKHTMSVMALWLIIALGLPQIVRAQSSTVQFRTYHCNDSRGIGMEAFQLLIPEGWRFDGGVQWHLDNPGLPATIAFTVKNPRSAETFRVFPEQTFFWTNNPMFFRSFPVGSRYLGNEVRQPVDAIDALENYIIPRFLPEAGNLKIIDEKELPELADQVRNGMQQGQGVSADADAAKVRIEYQENGVWYDEDIYGIVELSESSITNIYTRVTIDQWVIDHLFAFKAKKGQLDSHDKMFQTMMYSFKLNPSWFNKYFKLVGMLTRMQVKEIQTMGEISNIISQTGDEISQTAMSTYQNQQSVNDRIMDNFSQSIRGVDKYYNPLENKSVELPEGYKQVWGNSQGGYILSDDPNYNPNTDSNITWARIKKR